ICDNPVLCVENAAAIFLWQTRPNMPGSLCRSAISCRTGAPTSGKAHMSKQEMRDEAERLVREAMERKTVTIKQGNTRIETKCGKCGAPNRVSATPGQTRVPYTCKECGAKQGTL